MTSGNLYISETAQVSYLWDEIKYACHLPTSQVASNVSSERFYKYFKLDALTSKQKGKQTAHFRQAIANEMNMWKILNKYYALRI
jgi:hypothetical protein